MRLNELMTDQQYKEFLATPRVSRKGALPWRIIYRATVKWKRDGSAFTDQRYSRGHSWSFDGGITVPASSSPLSVFVCPIFGRGRPSIPEEGRLSAALREPATC